MTKQFITNLRKRTPRYILTHIFSDEKVSLGTMTVLCSRGFHGTANCKHPLNVLRDYELSVRTCKVALRNI